MRKPRPTTYVPRRVSAARPSCEKPPFTTPDYGELGGTVRPGALPAGLPQRWYPSVLVAAGGIEPPSPDNEPSELPLLYAAIGYVVWRI